MANKHETILEIRADASNAKAIIAEVQAALDDLHRSAGSLSVGGSGGVGGAGGSGAGAGGGGGRGAGASGQAVDDYYNARRQREDARERQRQEDRAEQQRRRSEDQQRRIEEQARRQHNQQLDRFQGRLDAVAAPVVAGSVAAAASTGTAGFIATPLLTASMTAAAMARRRLGESQTRLLRAGASVAGAIPALGAVGAAGIAGLNAQFGRFREYGNLQDQASYAGMAGMAVFRGIPTLPGQQSLGQNINPLLTAGAELGMMPGEVAAYSRQLALAGGRFDGINLVTNPQTINGVAPRVMPGRGGTLANQPGIGLQLSRSSASVGAFGGLYARGAVGGGLRDMTAMQLRNTVAGAQSQGLFGSNIDRYLAAIASATDRMASAGLEISAQSINDFATAINRGGAGIGGLQIPRAVSAVTGDVRGAREQVFGGFRQLRQSALIADAASRAGSLEELGDILEGQTPLQSLEAQRRVLGGDLTSLSYRGDFSGGDADVLGGVSNGRAGSARGRAFSTNRLRRAQVSPIRRAQARQAAQITGRVARPGSAADLAQIMQTMNDLQNALDTLGTKIGGFTSSIISAMSKLSDKRLKSDIEEIEDHPYNQIGLKAYKWTWNDLAFEEFGLSGPAQGVIAQEVATVMPQAVHVQDGFYAVIYPMIDSLVNWGNHAAN